MFFETTVTNIYHIQTNNSLNREMLANIQTRLILPYPV